MPRRWVARRMIAWLNRCRRLAKAGECRNRNRPGALRGRRAALHRAGNPCYERQHHKNRTPAPWQKVRKNPTAKPKNPKRPRPNVSKPKPPPPAPHHRSHRKLSGRKRPEIKTGYKESVRNKLLFCKQVNKSFSRSRVLRGNATAAQVLALTTVYAAVPV